MNERIKELMKQAESSANEVFDFQGKQYSDIVMEKFTELIIRDCVKICYETTGNSYLNGVAAGTKIMLHFGVKDSETL